MQCYGLQLSVVVCRYRSTLAEVFDDGTHGGEPCCGDEAAKTWFHWCLRMGEIFGRKDRLKRNGAS